MSDLLELEGITATEPEHDYPLGPITLSLPQGAFGMIVGGPHAGKSWLLQVIAGDVLPTSGSMLFNKTGITDMPVWRRRHRGVVLASQTPPRFDLLSAEEQICLGLNRRRLPARHKLLLFKHLPEVEALLATPMQRLSRQAHRLIDIASCLVLAPSLMLIDEPATDFGPERALAIIASLRAAEISLLVADRYAVPMLEQADYGWLITQGQLGLQGPAATMAQNPIVQSACLGDDPAT